MHAPGELVHGPALLVRIAQDVHVRVGAISVRVAVVAMDDVVELIPLMRPGRKIRAQVCGRAAQLGEVPALPSRQRNAT